MRKRLISGPRVRVRSIPLDEWYQRLVKQEYARLKSINEKDSTPVGSSGLAEVKLRLFLSLLDKPEIEIAPKIAANHN